MIALKMDATELAEIDRKLAIFQASRNAVWQNMFRDMGNALVDRERTRIGDKYDPDGQPWAPWSPNYQGIRLLNRTGQMRSSFRARRTKRTLTIDNTAPYAKYHQHGTRKMPARPILGWGPDEIEIAQRHGLEALQEAFR